MVQSPLEIAGQVQQIGLAGDNETLANNGILPVTNDAMPYYAAWTRTDIALSAALLSGIAIDLREIVKYTKLIFWVLFFILIGIGYSHIR